MAIREYVKDGSKLFKVYVQARGKDLKRIRIQRIVSGIESLAVARKEEKRLIKELAEEVSKLEGKGLLWSEVLFRWEIAGKNNLLRSKLNKFTLSDHKSRLVRYTEPWLKKVASELTRADGRSVLNLALAKGASETLLIQIKSSVNLVYEWGIEEGLIQIKGSSPRSPVFGLEVGTNEEKPKPILTLDEVRRFLFEAKVQDNPWYPIWAFAVATGMRSGELMALEWGDIDDKNGVIRVSKSFNKRSKLVKCPKNGTWRNLDVSPQLRGLINELRVIRGKEVTVLPIPATWKNGFAGTVLRNFLKGIGINKPVVFHTLRACFATHLLSMGVEQSKVMRMGGWNDLKTFQIYLRLSGVDVKGITADFEVMPHPEASKNVVPLFS